jgi:hypothetical protein
MKRNFGERVFWIEQRAGGHFGFPDCLVAIDDALLPFELKASRDDLILSEMKEGRSFWYPNLRPEQRLVGRRLTNNGVPAFVVVGAVGTCYLFAATMFDVLKAMDNRQQCMVHVIENRDDLLSIIGY